MKKATLVERRFWVLVSRHSLIASAIGLAGESKQRARSDRDGPELRNESTMAAPPFEDEIYQRRRRSPLHRTHASIHSLGRLDGLACEPPLKVRGDFYVLLCLVLVGACARASLLEEP